MANPGTEALFWVVTNRIVFFFFWPQQPGFPLHPPPPQSGVFEARARPPCSTASWAGPPLGRWTGASSTTASPSTRLETQVPTSQRGFLSFETNSSRLPIYVYMHFFHSNWGVKVLKWMCVFRYHHTHTQVVVNPRQKMLPGLGSGPEKVELVGP